jgi:hypothetical protein
MVTSGILNAILVPPAIMNIVTPISLFIPPLAKILG